MKKALRFILCVVLAVPGSVGATDSDLDITFGNGGVVTTDFSQRDDAAYAVALQSDRKFVVVGMSRLPPPCPCGSDFALARYNNDGSLDTTFGIGGKTVTDFSGSDDAAYAVAVQNDGKIVVAGTSSGPPLSGNLALARYNADGSLDTEFGSNGRIITELQPGVQPLALQRDGKIVVAGSTSGTVMARFALARYNGDGSRDATFGMGSNVSTEFPGLNARGFARGYALAIQADDKLVVAGAIFRVGPSDFALARYNGDGSLDLTFGTDGRVITDFSGQDDVAYAVVLQPDGKILAAGGGGAIEAGLRLARYNTDGSLDMAFGAGGRVSHGSDARALAVQPDGKIVVGVNPWVSDTALSRFNSDGSVDTSFGRGGIAFGDQGAAGIAIQPDGKIIGVSSNVGQNSSPQNPFDFSVTRYSDGLFTLTLHPERVRPGDSFTATFSSTIPINETYYDVRFRAPGDNVDNVAVNWQRGGSAMHVVNLDTTVGSWIITGVRPHPNIDDHTAPFLSLTTELLVAP